MITGYVALILFTMPPNMPDVKLQFPASDIMECAAIVTDGFKEAVAKYKPLMASTRCVPVTGAPDQDHVD